MTQCGCLEQRRGPGFDDGSLANQLAYPLHDAVGEVVAAVGGDDVVHRLRLLTALSATGDRGSSSKVAQSGDGERSPSPIWSAPRSKSQARGP